MQDLGSFSDPEVQRCPFALIEKLHAEAPVYLDPRTGFYVVSRYDDIAYVSQNPELFSNRTTVILKENDDSPTGQKIAKRYQESGFGRMHTLVTNDPPSHSLYRATVDKVFTPSFVKKMEPYIVELAETLIDDFCEAGAADLQRDFCTRMPMYVIVDQLGLPRTEWRKFKHWSDAAIALINPALSDDERLRLSEIHLEMLQYLIHRAEDYRRAPEDKMLSNLAHAEVEGRQLTPTEFVSIAEQIFVAGNETTTSAIGHAVTMLIRDPALKQRLIAEPARIGAFTEEVLRLHAPSPHLYRQVMEGTRLGDVDLPKGSIVMLSYLAGNRDPEQFRNPDAVDLERPGIRNHLAFGRGIHYCLGNLLARAELRASVDRMLVRLPNIRFAPDHPEPQVAESFHVHTLDSLHVVFDPTPRRAADLAA